MTNEEIIQEMIEQALEDALLGYRDHHQYDDCLLYTSPSPRDVEESRMPSSA